MDVLHRKNWHPTAEEVYGIVRERAPGISLGTIYRNLDVLAREGLIQAIESAGLHRRYDGNPVPHFHFQCRQCRELWDMHPQEPWTPPPLEEYPGFEVTGFRLIFEGYCPECSPERDQVAE